MTGPACVTELMHTIVFYYLPTSVGLREQKSQKKKDSISLCVFLHKEKTLKYSYLLTEILLKLAFKISVGHV